MAPNDVTSTHEGRLACGVQGPSSPCRLPSGLSTHRRGPVTTRSRSPHVAGSLGGELARLVDHALEELEWWAAGQSFVSPVDAAPLDSSA